VVGQQETQAEWMAWLSHVWQCHRKGKNARLVVADGHTADNILVVSKLVASLPPIQLTALPYLHLTSVCFASSVACRERA
jgi:hypothetical protein